VRCGGARITFRVRCIQPGSATSPFLITTTSPAIISLPAKVGRWQCRAVFKPNILNSCKDPASRQALAFLRGGRLHIDGAIALVFHDVEVSFPSAPRCGRREFRHGIGEMARIIRHYFPRAINTGQPVAAIPVLPLAKRNSSSLTIPFGLRAIRVLQVVEGPPLSLNVKGARINIVPAP
jgi:hypothetical protein